MFLQQGQRRIVRRPGAGLLRHMAGYLPDRQSVVCPAHVSGGQNSQDQQEIHHEEQRQNANGGEDVAPEKPLHRIHDFAPFRLIRYPSPLAVTRETGLEGLASIFSRRWRIWVERVLS